VDRQWEGVRKVANLFEDSCEHGIGVYVWVVAGLDNGLEDVKIPVAFMNKLSVERYEGHDEEQGH